MPAQSPVRSANRHAQLLVVALIAGLLVPDARAQFRNQVEGNGAGENITTGDFNVAVGDSATFSIRSGSQTATLGYQAGYNVITSELVALGFLAGFINEQGFDNTFVGAEAGYANVDGGDNTFVGSEAGEENTEGYDNTFVGEEAGTCNTTGYENTYIGTDAGLTGLSGTCSTFSTGFKNTFVGKDTGSAITSGLRNSAVGADALEKITTGDRNTALGESAGIDISEGRYNTMLGQAAGANTEVADFNTFVGALAGWDNNRTFEADEANRNTYVGYYAGYTNRNGEDNVGMGHNADFDATGRTSGNQRNVFIGAEALIDGSSTFVGRDDNVIVGYGTRAAANNTVALGYNADVEGENGIALGYNADLDAAGAIIIGDAVTGSGTNSIAIGTQSSVTAENAIAIGNGTSVTSASEVTIGNSATTAIGGIVNWTATSDARLKTDVREDVPGLAFINRLRPVRYRFDADELRSLSAAGRDLEDALVAKAQVWQTGFLAQEVEVAAEAVGFAFSGVVAPTDGQTHYGLRYAEFVVPLTKAIQELDAREQAHDVYLDALAEQLARIKTQAASQPKRFANRPTPVAAQDVQQAEDALARLEALVAEQ